MNQVCELIAIGYRIVLMVVRNIEISILLYSTTYFTDIEIGKFIEIYYIFIYLYKFFILLIFILLK